jgi:hypothetical protein
LAQPTLFTFSSRGGEVAKPDVVAPGSALSTVPGFVDGSARFQGTSMASPQTAGAVACLVSAAQQEELTIHWGMVKRALIAAATRVNGLTLNDQGGGLVNLAGSWQLLAKLAGSESAHQVLWYRIETPCVFQADGHSEAAYWRTPGGVPWKPETVTFTVHPVFHPDLSPDEKDTFFRSFKLKSEADWLRLVPGKRYLRGDMGMTIDVQYDGKKLASPGAYAARVIGSLDGGDLSGLPAREFYLWSTIIIGEPMGAESGYTKSYEGKDLTQAGIDRYFVEVPAGASAMRVRLETSEDTGASKGARVRTEICTPEGYVRGGFVGYATLTGEQIKDMTVLTPELYPGIWEIDVASSRLAKDLSSYRLTVTCDGYSCDPDAITALPRKGTGKDAKATVTVTRAFRGTFRGEASAAVVGFRKQREVTIEDSDEWSHTFKLDSTTPRAAFHLEMDEATGNLFTDCAVNILDASGQVVRGTGFSGLEVNTGISLPEGQNEASYSLQVVGGFALAKDSEEWGFDLEEKYYLAHPVSGDVSRAGGGRLNLPCGVPTEVKVAFADEWPAPPEGLTPFGRIHFRDHDTVDKAPGDTEGRLVLEVPIRLE